MTLAVFDPWPAKWPRGWHVLDTPAPSGRGIPVRLAPGDVLLFSPSTPTLVQEAIIRAQRLAAPSLADASFTHVALYLGGGDIIDATLHNGVSVRPMAGALTEVGVMRARRLKGVDHAVATSICQTALSLVGARYAAVKSVIDALFDAALRTHAVAWYPALNKAMPFGISPRTPFYCSGLIEYSYAMAARVSFLAGSAAVMPHTLSSTTELVEVAARWS